jgi:hypothetical protein
MTGLNRIWRIGDSETNAAITNGNNTVIEFDEAVADDSQYVTGTTIDIDVDITQTSALKGDINPSQDGGVGSLRIMLKGVIKGKAAILGRQTLTRWLLEPKFTTNFPHGRFGTVLADLTEFNIEPLGTAATGYGWMIEDIQFIKDGEWQNKTVFTMTLKYNGAKAGVIANLP